jgi:hypothetical protein
MALAVSGIALAGCGGSSGPTSAPSPSSAAASPSESPSPYEVAAPVLTASPRPASSCTVSAKDLGAGLSQSCQFVATKRGGANAFYPAAQIEGDRTGAADVFVTRAGETTRYDVYHAKSGCLQGFIQPGDRVIVVIRQVLAGHVDFSLSAGAGFGCN